MKIIFCIEHAAPVFSLNHDDAVFGALSNGEIHFKAEVIYFDRAI